MSKWERGYGRRRGEQTPLNTSSFDKTPLLQSLDNKEDKMFQAFEKARQAIIEILKSRGINSFRAIENGVAIAEASLVDQQGNPSKEDSDNLAVLVRYFFSLENGRKGVLYNLLDPSNPNYKRGNPQTRVIPDSLSVNDPRVRFEENDKKSWFKGPLHPKFLQNIVKRLTDAKPGEVVIKPLS